MSFDNGPGHNAFVLTAGIGATDSGGADGLYFVHDELRTALARHGVDVPDKLRPHVTLLYDDRLVPDQAVEPITWTVRELVPIESWPGQGVYIERVVRKLGA